MNIDPAQSGQILASSSQSEKTTDETSKAFNREVRLAEVKNGTILIDDLLKSNGLQKKRMLGLGAYGKVHPVARDGENQFVLKVKRQSVMNKPFDNELSPFMVQGKGTPVVEAYFGVIRHKVDRHLEVIYSIEDFQLKSQDFDLEAVALEMVDGKDFDKYLKDFDPSYSPIPEEKMLMLAQEVSRGASQINDNLLIHRDLKPKNIMCSEKDGKIKLTFIDFSTATTVENAKTMFHDGMDGTDGFTPPEAYESKGRPSIKDDSWALGAILTSIAFGKTPNEIYDETTGGKLGTHYEDIRGFAEWDDDKKREVLLNEFKDGVSDKKKKYVDVIIALTKLDPEERATTTDAYRKISAITAIDEGFEEFIPVDEDSDPGVIVSELNRVISSDSGIDTAEQAVEAMLSDNLPTGNLDRVDLEAENSNVEESPQEGDAILPNTEVESDDSAEQSTGKAKSPLEMTFLERQADAANKRKDREAQYKTRAEAEKEWVEGFRGNKTKNKVDRNATKGNNQKKP